MSNINDLSLTIVMIKSRFQSESCRLQMLNVQACTGNSAEQAVLFYINIGMGVAGSLHKLRSLDQSSGGRGGAAHQA
jgi:hypothetical protein